MNVISNAHVEEPIARPESNDEIAVTAADTEESFIKVDSAIAARLF